jgi:hypothetical protein
LKTFCCFAKIGEFFGVYKIWELFGILQNFENFLLFCEFVGILGKFWNFAFLTNKIYAFKIYKTNSKNGKKVSPKNND